MPEATQIKIVEIVEDHLGDTYPRVLANVVNDEGKESKLTIFKSKKGIIPQLNHAYMGFLVKPKKNPKTGELYKIWSFNIAWEVHSEPTEDTQEPIDEPVYTGDEEPEQPPPTPPEPETPKEPLVYTVPEIITETRLRVAEIEARRENRLTRNIPLTEFIDNCQRIIKFVEKGV